MNEVTTIAASDRAKFDERDHELARKKLAAWNRRKGPRVGDFVHMPDGRCMRFSHDWGDDIQVSEGGSYYLGEGFVSMSGGLEPGIPKESIEATAETRDGWFWFFHHDFSEAHNGVNFMAPCRVYRYVPGEKWPSYTVQCGYAAYYANLVTVRAPSVEDACQKAIEAANGDSHWRSLDHCGDTFVDAIAEGQDIDPWGGGLTSAIPVPLGFREEDDWCQDLRAFVDGVAGLETDDECVGSGRLADGFERRTILNEIIEKARALRPQAAPAAEPAPSARDLLLGKGGAS